MTNVFPATAETVEKLPPGRIDLAKIPRTILKEPAYQTKSPGYCLLVFGPEAETRIWMVIDGESAYLDRNGNGDLTDDGEGIGRNHRKEFALGNITEGDGKTTHRSLRVKVMDDSSFELKILTADRCSRYIGLYSSLKPRLSEQPATAPIIHPNGTITLAPYTPVNFSLRSADEERDTQYEWLNLVAGSYGWGPGTFTFLKDAEDFGCDGDRKILADIEFPSRTTGAPPIISRQALMTEG